MPISDIPVSSTTQANAVQVLLLATFSLPCEAFMIWGNVPSTRQRSLLLACIRCGPVLGGPSRFAKPPRAPTARMWPVDDGIHTPDDSLFVPKLDRQPR